MADPNQLALLKRSVTEWNLWRKMNPYAKVNLSSAGLHKTNLSDAILAHADLSSADLSNATLTSVDFRRANLSGADLSGANLSHARLNGANLSNANLRNASLRYANIGEGSLNSDEPGGEPPPPPLEYDILGRPYRLPAFDASGLLPSANFNGADLNGADITGVERYVSLWRDTTPKFPPDQPSSPKNTKSEPQPSRSSPSSDWLSMVQTVGTNLFLAAAELASIIQGLDVVERRWREHKAKRKPGTQTASPSSQKMPVSDKEIIEIRLLMDDGSHHTLKRWVSDPDTLRRYIDAFSDPASKVKPLQVVFMKRKGRALVVDVTEGGKDNRQLNVILDYLEADLK